MTENERKAMLITADTLQGEINRMCVTHDLSEFDTMYAHAKVNLEKLSKIIYLSRFNLAAPLPEQNTLQCKDCIYSEYDRVFFGKVWCRLGCKVKYGQPCDKGIKKRKDGEA